MSAKRIHVNINDFKKGKSAYLTKYFITYNVKFVEDYDRYVIVQVQSVVFIHRSAMEALGFKKVIRLFDLGSKIRTTPEKLWLLETERRSFWTTIRSWLHL